MLEWFATVGRILSPNLHDQSDGFGTLHQMQCLKLTTGNGWCWTPPLLMGGSRCTTTWFTMATHTIPRWVNTPRAMELLDSGVYLVCMIVVMNSYVGWWCTCLVWVRWRHRTWTGGWGETAFHSFLACAWSQLHLIYMSTRRVLWPGRVLVPCCPPSQHQVVIMYCCCTPRDWLWMWVAHIPAWEWSWGMLPPPPPLTLTGGVLKRACLQQGTDLGATSGGSSADVCRVQHHHRNPCHSV